MGKSPQGVEHGKVKNIRLLEKYFPPHPSTARFGAQNGSYFLNFLKNLIKFLTCSGNPTKKAKIRGRNKKAPRYVHITECPHSVNGSYPGAARST